MYLGRVVGCVWSTVKDPSLLGQRLLVVQPITPGRVDNGKPLICLDSTGAGAGETVYWVKGKEASFPFGVPEVIADTTIVGIVDTIHLAKAAASAALDPASASTVETRRTPLRGATKKGRRC
jgi:microcompartment protein CcmK/EutM